MTTLREPLGVRRMDGDLSLFNGIGALVVVLDRAGRIVHWNMACAELTGYALAAVAGRAIWDVLLVEEDVEPVRAVHARLCGSA